MNPCYIGTLELFDNFKYYIEHFYDDFKLCFFADFTLYYKGFTIVEELSVKMNQLFKLSSQELAKLMHYGYY